MRRGQTGKAGITLTEARTRAATHLRNGYFDPGKGGGYVFCPRCSQRVVTEWPFGARTKAAKVKALKEALTVHLYDCDPERNRA